MHENPGGAQQISNNKLADPNAHGQPSGSNLRPNQELSGSLCQPGMENKIKSSKSVGDKPQVHACEALIQDSWHEVHLLRENAEAGDCFVSPTGCHSALQGHSLNLAQVEPSLVVRNRIRRLSRSFSSSDPPANQGMYVLAVARLGEGQPCKLIDGEVLEKRKREMQDTLTTGGNTQGSFWEWEYKILFDHGDLAGQEHWVAAEHVLSMYLCACRTCACLCECVCVCMCVCV
jgi:hypothetical protein